MKSKKRELDGREAMETEKPESALEERLRALLVAFEAEKSRTTALSAENDGLKQENWELKIDPRTGLERERRYYESLNKKIEEIISDPELADTLEQDSLDARDLEKLGAVALSVTAADLGYLSKYNEDPEIAEHYGEHGGGDKILQETGRIIQSSDPKKRAIKPELDPQTSGYRVGGDEFAMIHELAKDKAKEVAREFTLKQAGIEIKGADLSPAINCGTAGFRDGVEAFVAAFSKEERQELTAEEKAKKIQHLLTSIADRRSKVAKGMERLAAMTMLLAKEPEKFRRNHKWMQKGAFGMVEGDFVGLIKLVGAPEKMEKAVRDLVKEKLEVQNRREDDQRLKERAIIVEISDREFLS